jgi:hypothetical protein
MAERGRPQLPTVLVDLADRQMAARGILSYWRVRGRQLKQFDKAKLYLTPEDLEALGGEGDREALRQECLAPAKNDHPSVQILKMQAMVLDEAREAGDRRMQAAVLAKMQQSANNADKAFTETMSEQVRVLTEATKLKAKYGSPEPEGEDAEAIEASVREDTLETIRELLQAGTTPEALAEDYDVNLEDPEIAALIQAHGPGEG